jgi:HlyD family secretion protein
VGVAPQSFDIRVNTVGVLDAANSHVVTSAVPGDKGKLIYLVEDGARVEPGDILIKLDPSGFEENANRLKGEVEGLEAAVDAAQQVLEWEKTQVEREIRTGEFNLRVAELDYEKLIKGDGPIQLNQIRSEQEKIAEEYRRYHAFVEDISKLSDQGYSNPTEAILAKQKLAELEEKLSVAIENHRMYREHVFPSLKEMALAKVEKAKMEQEQIRNGGVFKIAKAASKLREIKGKLTAHRASLVEAQNAVAKTAIHAPFGGIAVHYEAFRDGQKRKPRIGDQVWQNQPLLYLPDISAMVVKTQVREIDLHKIDMGQICRVTVDAFPDTTYQGEVAFIGIMADRGTAGGQGEKYFQLSVALTETNTRLRPGMTARVSIRAHRVENALAVPIQAIFTEGGETYCYKYQGPQHGFMAQPVTCGKQNETWVEIVSGLARNDRISLVKPEASRIR